MRLKKLEIGVAAPYKKNAGEYEGVAAFSDKTGEVKLNLNSEQIEQMFSICADAILGTAKRAADNMTCNIIEHQKSLEGE